MKIEITREQINEYIEKHRCCGATKQTLQDLFPDAFKPILEVGKWYKWYDHIENTNVLICITNIDENSISRYGFVNNKWNSDFRIYTGEKYNEAIENLIEATEQEVFESLKNEAVKRGFVFGSKINPLEDEENSKDNVFKVGSTMVFENGKLYVRGYGRFCIFKNGNWATLIPVKKMTQSEIETELGYKIEIV